MSSENATIVVRDLSHKFTTREGPVVALDSISMEIESGEWMAVLGPSGSGKTTLLRCIAGLERPSSGEIIVGGRTVYSSERGIFVPPERRDLGMVFQSYALWPHMTAFENVAYPLLSGGRIENRKDVKSKVEAALDRVGCLDLTKRHPSQMSGGQQQRVAVARAIVSDVKAVLFDEPLSSVDLRVREKLRTDLRMLQSELGLCAIYVTHDQSEAFVLGHRITVMESGRVVQSGPPEEVYESPVNSFVAEFVGSSNVIPGRVEGVSADGVSVETAVGRVLVTGDRAGEVEVASGDQVELAIRSEVLLLESERPTDSVPTWEGIVASHSFMGMYTEYVVRVKDNLVVVRRPGRHPLEERTRVWVRLPPGSTKILPEHTERISSRVAPKSESQMAES